MKDWDALKEEIRQRIDLVEIVSEHVSLRRAGRDFVGLCPFHEEKTPSFSVSQSKQIFKCFGCGAGGDLFSFVQQREVVNFVEAMRILADRAGVDLERARRSGSRSGGSNSNPNGIDRSDIARANAWAMGAFQTALADEQLGKVARDYLVERGIPNDIVEKFAIGWAPEAGGWLPEQARKAGINIRALQAGDLVRVSDRYGAAHGGASLYGTFRGRLMFPIRDTMNRVVGFGGRTLIGDRAKYLNTSHTPLYDKGTMLYGIDQARMPMSDKRQAIVVEGYTDCIACHQYGLDRAVATLGTALTDQQISLLRRWCDEVVLLFDADSAGEEAADRALGVALRYNLSVRIASVPDGKDPSDYLTANGAAGVDSLLNSSVDALRFKWGRTCEQFAEMRGGGQRQAIEAFISLVSQMASYGTLDAIQRGLVINQLSGLLAVSQDDIVKLLKTAQQKVRGQNARASARAGGGASADAQERSRTGRHEFGPTGLDAEQAALRGMLQVLINEPGHYAEVADVFVPSRFQDGELRRLADEVVGLCRSFGEFQIPELMDRFRDEPALGRLVTDFVYEGERQGQYQAVIDDTRNRLLQLNAVREGQRLAKSVTDGSGARPEDSGEFVSDDAGTSGSSGGAGAKGYETQHLEQLQKLLSERRGFAPSVPSSKPIEMPRK
ncbi:MAG TPA: DNA primase [Phycisphaerae bacterium]|nr:DNA primase [Phycisphaerae bacterium]